MATCLALVLVLLSPGLSTWASSAPLAQPRMPVFQGCKHTFNVSVLGALPGGGWDNLRNVELGLVLQRDYSQCRTTEDGEYLIPDDVHLVTRRESVVETRAELIDRWVDYTDAWAASINTEVSFLSALNGKFSLDSENVKKYDLEYQTVTTRVQVRHSVYSVKSPETPTFHPDFREQLLILSDYLDSNRSLEAQYLAEMLVRNYGTHVLTDVEAGATLVQEDQVRRELAESQAQEKINITLAASVLFFQKLGIGASVSGQVDERLLRNYVQNTVGSQLRSHGGMPVAPGLTLQKWQESIGNRLVTIGRAGLPLPDLLQPDALPELPPPSVERLEAAVRNAIHRYYAVNAHPGCVEREEPAFNPQANVDDGSCAHARGANFSFGGFFQECEVLSGADAERFCQAHHTPNPLTGNSSCPAEYQAFSLYRGLKTWSAPRQVCKKKCSKCWLFFQCCQDVCSPEDQSNSAHLAASWCVPPELASPPPLSGFLFGGLYSPGSPNPLTQTQACPDHFYPLALLEDLKVCVSSDRELGAAQAVPFGGFFSCQQGNPLAGVLKGQSPGFLQEMFYQDSATDHPMKCPAGYNQHQAFVSDGCQILYCLKAGALLEQQPLALRLPPFLPHPALLRSNRTHSFSQPDRVVAHRSSEPSSWVIATTLLAAVVAVLGISFGLWRCYRSRVWRKHQGYEGIVENADPVPEGTR
ncbi:macrophage-expressed gene 1 protein-like [Sorex fumeus]|uniref:macrophage-expressed gene 1 protein-like n=1 Tax=Sorex fumeus TaxID=62283 RepID=UPI0024AD8219|nr:macrophage-expressed gene 1 protein-like [Sorex fumeus]